MNGKINSIAADAGKVTKKLFDKSKERAIQAVDKNNDGTFDLADVSVMADNVGNVIKRGKQALAENIEERSYQVDLKSLRPVFPETLLDTDFLMTKLIRITERDKRYISSRACIGSIGYLSDLNGVHIVNLFEDSIDAFGLSFYPNRDCGFFYVNPCDRDHYISLEDYFSYLKKARVAELKKIALDLGAKHFIVIYREEKAEHQKSYGKTSLKAVGEKAEVERTSSSQNSSKVEIASEMTSIPHSPIQPQVKYLKGELDIQSLISARMHPETPILHEHYTFNLSNSSGIKESDAVKIDTVLKGLKCSGNLSIASEARRESNRYFEYEIDF